ncbi:hypothetical protein FA15DRAFT_655875 [Coprinopsis marcescibilis]|uniref:F-box domain-containing protein n=1 Tax=Coprinopsis marcescibilis TaxID=230819 RepID=A0A5C3KVJ0_COPMA|nr:hypothetical protein FA15DRAFT_655875 [Coprinopsis marcescibilis]
MAQVTLPTSLCLTPDLLQPIFKLAAATDQRTAVRLALVCQVSRAWVEPIIYAIVKLTKEASVKALLRTILTSGKPQAFFVNHVRSLVITQNTHLPSLGQVLLACPRITSLTFWSIPVQDEPQSMTRGPRLYLSSPRSSVRQEASHLPFPDDCFETIRPNRLAAVFRDQRNTFPKPNFSRGIFTSVTHLSVLNCFDVWSGWDHFHHLQSLTHLSLDLNVSKMRSLFPHTNDLARCHRRLALCLRYTIHQCENLQVLILVLLFTEQPEIIARRLLTSMEELDEEESRTFPFNNPLERHDRKLAFVRKRNVFEAREAHSKTEKMMWEAAEHQVRTRDGHDPRIVLI